MGTFRVRKKFGSPRRVVIKLARGVRRILSDGVPFRLDPAREAAGRGSGYGGRTVVAVCVELEPGWDELDHDEGLTCWLGIFRFLPSLSFFLGLPSDLSLKIMELMLVFKR